MGYFQQNREIIAKVFMIVGGIILALACITWIMSISPSFNFMWPKWAFCCGYGLYAMGLILNQMIPEQSKTNRIRAYVGIFMLMCCIVISVVYLITGSTAQIFLPLIIGLSGYCVGLDKQNC